MKYEELKSQIETGKPFLVRLDSGFFRDPANSNAGIIIEVKKGTDLGSRLLLNYELPKILNQNRDLKYDQFFDKLLQKTSDGWSGITTIYNEEQAGYFTVLNVCGEDGCVAELTDPVFSTMAKRYLPILQSTPVQNTEEPTSNPHLAWMLMELVQNGTMSETKKHRWLGYVQGVMVMNGLLNVADEREATRPVLNGK